MLDEEFLQELFASFGEVTVRKWFGGQGILHRGLTFAAVLSGSLRLKADDETVPDFESEGMEPWGYQHKNGKQVTTGYWTVPDRLLDDPDDFRVWAQKAFEVAVRADAKKSPKQRKLVDL